VAPSEGGIRLPERQRQTLHPWRIPPAPPPLVQACRHQAPPAIRIETLCRVPDYAEQAAGSGVDPACLLHFRLPDFAFCLDLLGIIRLSSSVGGNTIKGGSTPTPRQTSKKHGRSTPEPTRNGQTRKTKAYAGHGAVWPTPRNPTPPRSAPSPTTLTANRGPSGRDSRSWDCSNRRTMSTSEPADAVLLRSVLTSPTRSHIFAPYNSEMTAGD
jgi:hypothetical protein